MAQADIEKEAEARKADIAAFSASRKAEQEAEATARRIEHENYSRELIATKESFKAMLEAEREARRESERRYDEHVRTLFQELKEQRKAFADMGQEFAAMKATFASMVERRTV